MKDADVSVNAADADADSALEFASRFLIDAAVSVNATATTAAAAANVKNVNAAADKDAVSVKNDASVNAVKDSRETAKTTAAAAINQLTKKMPRVLRGFLINYSNNFLRI